MIDNSIYEAMRQLLRNLPKYFHRYLYDRLPTNARLVGVVGPRGVGKSTLLLQKIASSDIKALYVDADNLYFASHTLVDMASDFVKDDGKLLAIDEVHKYPGWSKELKQIHDTLPDLHVMFTGSSILDIRKGEADLSRRALIYNLQGLSFREYLELFYKIKLPVYNLEQVLSHQVDIANPEHPLPLFHRYLRTGYFPFSQEPEFEMRLNQIVTQTVEVDIPLYAGMMASTARKLKHLLAVLSTLAPYKPSFDNLTREVGVSKNNLPEYIAMLERAGMIALLRDDTAGLRGLGKIDKLYLDNPNFIYGLAGVEAEIGTVRETFFQNQMRIVNHVVASRKADFCIGKYTFEIGGRNKGKKQLDNDPNGFVVKDDIEFGSGNVIPLWHFGLMY